MSTHKHCRIPANIQSFSPLQRSASSTKAKKKKVAGGGAAASFTTPRSPARVKVSSTEINDHGNVRTSDDVLHDQMVALMIILLKSSTSRTFHDFSTMQGHIHARAVASIEEELRVTISRLEQLRGPSPSHRVTACAQLLASLTHDVEAAVFSADRRAVNALRNDQVASKVEAEQQLRVFNERLARKDQTILAMQAEHANMDFKNKSLIRTVELLSKELEKCNSSLTSMHQRSVEVHMQAIDFKAEVDKRAQRVLQSIQSRVGFVPETIQKHISQLTALLPPGDANYDRVRMELYKKSIPGVNNGSGSAPGTPTSTSRKAAAFLAAGLTIQPPANANSSPRSSFTSSSPSTTNASGSNSPPRFNFERSGVPAEASAAPASAARPTGIAMSTTPSPINTNSTTNNSSRIPKDWTPASSNGPEATSSEHADSAQLKSRLSPTSRTSERRQMLITSLFPRASFTVQDSTGIANMQFPVPDEIPSAASTRASQEKAVVKPPTSPFALEHPSSMPTAPVRMDPSYEKVSAGNTRYPAAIARHGGRDAAEQHESEHSDQEEKQQPQEEEDESVEVSPEDSLDGEESDDEDADWEGEGEDAGETRTNPSVSQHTFSTDPHSDEDSASDESDRDDNAVDSTSPGADDEQPVGIAGHPHAHHSHAAQGTTLHYLPRVSAQFSPGGHADSSSGPTRPAAYSESDEGGDFHENMKKFLQTFQESQLLDISDNEMDGERQQQHLQSIALAAASKRRGGNHAGKTTKAKKGTKNTRATAMSTSASGARSSSASRAK